MRLRTLLPSELTAEEVLALNELRLKDEPLSDMSWTLRDLADGRNLDPILRIVLAESEGVILGWATAELFSFFTAQEALLNVFVAPASRRQGIGRSLAYKANDHLKEITNQPVRLLSPFCEKVFSTPPLRPALQPQLAEQPSY